MAFIGAASERRRKQRSLPQCSLPQTQGFGKRPVFRTRRLPRAPSQGSRASCLLWLLTLAFSLFLTQQGASWPLRCPPAPQGRAGESLPRDPGGGEAAAGPGDGSSQPSQRRKRRLQHWAGFPWAEGAPAVPAALLESVVFLKLKFLLCFQGALCAFISAWLRGSRAQGVPPHSVFAKGNSGACLRGKENLLPEKALSPAFRAARSSHGGGRKGGSSCPSSC